MGEPLDYERLDPDRPARQREAARRRAVQQLPPGRIGEWGRSSDRRTSTVRIALYACCVVLILLLSRLLTGTWIHGWSTLLTLTLMYGLLALFGLVNRRRP